MLKKIYQGLIVTTLGALLSANLMAMDHMLTPGVNIMYELFPHKPETFSNPFFLTINALCTMQTSDFTVLHIKGLGGQSTINDLPVDSSEFDMIVENSEKVRISAKPQASVQITNESEMLVRAFCKTV